MFPRIHYPPGGSGDTTISTNSDTNIINNLDDTINLTTESDWWANAIEDDSFYSQLPFDASENGLWNGKFVPPPPRPPFLEESVSSDGLTTCDLCTWAWHDKNAFSLDGTIAETAGELGWTFSLIIVSVISALIGAIIMITVLKCRRKTTNSSGNRPTPWWYRSNTASRNNITTKPPTESIRGGGAHGSTTNSGVWTWLTKTNRRQPTAPDQLGSPTHPSAENHYSHMDDAYSPVGVGEALYAELDRESIQSANPSYQNTAYSQCGEADHDMPIVVSSAPSSAYYSDLSNSTVPTERAYEVVGLTVMSSPLPNWTENGCGITTTTATTTNSHILDGDVQTHINLTGSGRKPPRLHAINEATATIPSDYV